MEIDPLISLALLGLIALSGLFSGLTLGLFSLSRTELERKIALGNVRAKKVYKVRRNGNLLLVTLLLGNVAVNAAISILLGTMTSGVVAGILATALIVVFGEIIPQATCARYALIVGAKTAWLVRIFIWLFLPVSYPLAWLLDQMLGEELRTVWSKRELEHIIKMHEDDPRSTVDADEERIMLGALSFSEKSVGEVMTLRKEVYELQKASVLNQKLLHEIRETGFTRIPVYSKDINDVVGILYAKDLIGLDEEVTVEKMMRTASLVRVSKTRKLDSLLNHMIAKRAHLALVTQKTGKLLGIVTLEDVLEEIIGREIADEDDE